MKVCFETFGCRLNRAEALAEEAQYLARGWERTERHDDAQLIVVRGCSVTARAQRDCERLIEHIKRKYPFKRVMVTGCLPSADKNYFIRNKTARGNLGSFRVGLGSNSVKLGSNSVGIGSSRVDLESNSVTLTPTDPNPTLIDPNRPYTTLNDPKPTLNDPNPTLTYPIPTRTARAYLKVQDGCAGGCTFCIVPKFRGVSKSVPWDEVLDTARRFLDAGYHEIVVTGCNLVQYLSDGKRLPDLVSALAGLGDAHRIRLGSIEPGPVALEVVSAMAEHSNVCRFLHVPVQTGSGRILAAMRRPYTVHDADELLAAATRRMPSLGLGFDLMTGFPGETVNDQMATLGFLRRHPFTKAHVFPYSERPGTIAATLPDAVPPEIRSARARELAQLADERRTAFAKRFRGREVEIVVEDEKHVAGWTSEYLWCRIGDAQKDRLARGRAPGDVRRKDLVRLRVRETDGHVLIGNLA